MARPTIVQRDEQLGFYWTTADGRPVALEELVRTDEEPDRLLPTHLEALDDALIVAAERFGEILGGAKSPADPQESTGLRDLYRTLDRLVHEYAAALGETGGRPDARAGQIIGTATLFSIKAREPLGLLGPAPLDDQLEQPGVGVVSGFGELAQVDEERPWTGGRWVVRTPEGARYPATLSMLLFDSSGVNKDAALTEHRTLLESVLASATDPAADPFALACAIDWLLYDLLMALRDGPDSAAIDLKGKRQDAELIVSASSASIRTRARVDPGLLRLSVATP